MLNPCRANVGMWGGGRLVSEKILIVDDEQEIADLVELYLKNENYTVSNSIIKSDNLVNLFFI